MNTITNPESVESFIKSCVWDVHSEIQDNAYPLGHIRGHAFVDGKRVSVWVWPRVNTALGITMSAAVDG